MTNTLPLYKATKSLDVNYTFNDGPEDASILLEGAPTHSMLSHAYTDLLAERQRLNYTASIDTVNIATAAITVLFTDTTTEEGYLGEDVSWLRMPLEARKAKPVLTVTDLYPDSYNLTRDITGKKIPKNKGRRSHDFNTMLYNHVEGFAAIAPSFYTKHVITTPQQIEAKIANSNFHEAFHHSEQGIMFSMSATHTIKSIGLLLRNVGRSLIYAIFKREIYSLSHHKQVVLQKD